MKYYIIAGEASGDLHGANLMKQIKMKDAEAEFRFWGGDKMAAIGGEPRKHIKDLAFMGFIEVLMNIRTILKNIKFCQQDILAYQPDALVLVDYPGFNLRIAEFAYQNKTLVHYYISPQLWAWKQSRVKKIKAFVHHLYVILPFEQPFYQKFDYPVHFVGHPLLDAIKQFDLKENQLKINQTKPIVALLPGSRKQEIKKMLGEMLATIDAFPNHQFVVAGAPSIDKKFYATIIGKRKVDIVYQQTYELLSIAKAALVTSGTATLETALFKVPQVVCYKGSLISYWIAKQLIKVKYISLVNLITGRETVKELIQSELNKKNLTQELTKILMDKKCLQILKNEYIELEKLLGAGGASERTAKLIIETTVSKEITNHGE